VSDQCGHFKGIQLRSHISMLPCECTVLRVPFSNNLTLKVKRYTITRMPDESEPRFLSSPENAHGAIFVLPLCLPHVSSASLRNSATFQIQTEIHIWVQILLVQSNIACKVCTKVFKRQACALRRLAEFLLKASLQSTLDYFDFRRGSW